jgi:hypothetical protein
MSDFNELLNKAQKLDDVVMAESGSIDTFDRAVLDGSGLFFEILFSHIFGFQWIRYFLTKISAAEDITGLPYYNYRFSIHDDMGTANDIKDKLNYFMAHHSDHISYFSNTYEYPFVILHWIGAHFGKAVGWLIASPFAALGYVGKNLYYGIKKAIANNSFKKEISKFDPADLAEKAFMYIGGAYLVNNYVTKYLAKLSPRQVLDGMFAKSNVETTLVIRNHYSAPQNYFDHMCRPDNVSGHYSKLEMRWNSYREARENYLESERKWALAKIILSGVLIVPLFFTISAYKKLVSFLQKDKVQRDEIAKDFNDDKDPRFTRGSMYLVEAKTKEAQAIFIKVPSNSHQFKNSMSEVGHILLNKGEAKQAAPYFELAKEPRAQFIADKLAQNQDLTLGELETEYANSLSLSGALPRIGTFAQTLPAEFKSLDDDEDLSLRLSNAT